MTPRPGVLRGWKAIAGHLAASGWSLSRFQLYRLTQRSEHPLRVDGPVGMPVATAADLDRWVAQERRRMQRLPPRPPVELLAALPLLDALEHLLGAAPCGPAAAPLLTEARGLVARALVLTRSEAA